MDIDITMLGGFAVAVDKAMVDPAHWRRRHAAALVKILALEPRRTLHRERVIDLLWPELTIEDAAPRLHKAAHYARRALGGPGTVVLAAESVTLLPRDAVRVDVLQFRDFAGKARGTGDPAAAGQAADSYTGTLLPDDPYEPWAQEHRERLRLTYLDTLRRAGRWQTLATVDPTDEDAHLRVMTALTRGGHRLAALRQYERLEHALREELGLTPSRAAAAIRDQLLASNPSPAERPSAGSDAGSHGRSSEPRQAPRPADDRRPVSPAARPPQRGNHHDEGVGGAFPDVEDTQRLFAMALAEVGKTAMLAWLDRQNTTTGGSCDAGGCAAQRCQPANPNGRGRGELDLAGQS